MDYIFVISIAFIIFTIYKLSSRKNLLLSDKILITWMAFIIPAEITFFLSSQNLFVEYHWFYEISCSTHVLHGTFFYLYIKSLTTKDFKFEKKQLIHLIPFIIYLGYKIYIKWFDLVDCLNEGGCSHSDNIYSVISVYMKFAILISYVSYTIYTVLKYQREGKLNILSNNIALWIKSVCIGVVILMTLVFGLKLMGNIGMRFFLDEIIIINIVVSIFVISFIFIYTKYSLEFTTVYNETENVKDIPKSTKTDKLENSTDKENYINICSLVRKNELFRDGDLTLRKLSENIKLPEHTVSNSINRVSGLSYTDYINKFRIDYFIKLLEEGKHENNSIINLAYDCGFNSKSSFNRVFKQFTKQTPTEFIKNMSK
ncbi:MAG: AraC family transcriptional regulator [Marinifilaceae bacterium]|jgi:AraC-like DNA-binding protein|nr:AraC family transcriptional regulator [Marinifilaceae bacterium]